MDSVIQLEHRRMKKPTVSHAMTFRALNDQVMDDETLRDAVIERRAIIMAAEFVRNARYAANLTQEGLANKLHISQSRVCKLEKAVGVHGPSVALLMKVAYVCGQPFELKVSPPSNGHTDDSSTVNRRLVGA